jgi:hypothetical protein
MAFVDRDGILRAHDLHPAKARTQQRQRVMQFLLMTCLIDP